MRISGARGMMHFPQCAVLAAAVAFTPIATLPAQSLPDSLVARIRAGAL
jgi:hypothetical protein